MSKNKFFDYFNFNRYHAHVSSMIKSLSDSIDERVNAKFEHFIEDNVSDGEILDARKGERTLGKKIDKIDEKINALDSQLEHMNDNITIINNQLSISEINEKINKEGTFLFKNGLYLIEKGESINVHSDSRLIFEPNSVLKYNDNSSTHYVVLNINNCKNVIVEDVNIIGCRDTHIGVDGEWGYGIEISASENIKLIRPTIEKTWGDGIYIGYKYYSTNALYKTKNISVIRPHIYKCSRNGISICSGDNITIDTPYIEGVDRINPKTGIDIETENSNESLIHLSNVKILNPTTIDNGVGIGFALYKGYEGCEIFINNHLNKNSVAYSWWGDGSLNCKVDILNSKVYNTPYFAIDIENKTNNSKLTFKNIDIIDKGLSSEGGDYGLHSAIFVKASKVGDFGNIEFNNINISTTKNTFTNPLTIDNATGSNLDVFYKNITIDNLNSNGLNGALRLRRADLTSFKLNNVNCEIITRYYMHNLDITNYYNHYIYPQLLDWSTLNINANAPNGYYKVTILDSNSKTLNIVRGAGLIFYPENKAKLSMRTGETIFYKNNSTILFLQKPTDAIFAE